MFIAYRANKFGAIMNIEKLVYESKKVVVLSNTLKIKDIPKKFNRKIELSSLSAKSNSQINWDYLLAEFF